MDAFIKTKEMKNSEYLYGVKSLYFKDMKYEDAINKKIELAKSVVADLMETPFMKQDTQRINSCVDSIKFNKSLVDEMTEDKRWI